MQASGFLAQAALARAAQQPWAPLPAFSDTRPTYSRDAQDDGEGGPHEGARRGFASPQTLSEPCRSCLHAGAQYSTGHLSAEDKGGCFVLDTHK